MKYNFMLFLTRLTTSVFSTAILAATMMLTGVMIAATTAIIIKGYSQEGLFLFGKILGGITRVGFGVCIVLFLIFLWKMKQEQKLLNQSRAQCREAYKDLFDYLQANCLKGSNAPDCWNLRQSLKKELDWHCEQYPFDTKNPEIERFRDYCQRVRLLLEAREK